MNNLNSAILINLAGFTTGAALYALLFWMVAGRSPRRLLLATALLGLIWNVGGLAAYGARDFGFAPSLPLVLTLAYAALGFLPAVVVNLAVPTGPLVHWLAWAAYAMSGAAALSHLYGAWTGAGPSPWALRGLTAGYVMLLAALFIVTRKQDGNPRGAWASALAVFALSALHLSGHRGEVVESWWAELAGHHSSVLLALLILYQDYRFAFADLFLKRALSLLLLVTLAFGLYTASLGRMAGRRDQWAAVVPLILWILTALAYPALRRFSHWFVEQVVLRRPDYTSLRNELAARLAQYEIPTEVLQELCRVLTPALAARDVGWLRSDSVTSSETPPALARFAQWQSGATTECVALLPPEAKASALIFVPTAEPPFYTLVAGPLEGGRRLLSDDTAFLEAVALLTARRLDALRVTRERYEKDLQAKEISKLATEAQLRALRAQINPHFLFNALTTIGYLIQTAPPRALETLLKLTSLLRGSLRAADEFVTLDEELNIIAAYLDIEQARFEERLRVRLAVPENLRGIRLPALLLQPLVENAVKHGVAPMREGGEVTISATVETIDEKKFLCLRVSDTGAGVSAEELARQRQRGVGLSNIEERLGAYYGAAASLRLETAPGQGATAELLLPLTVEGARPLRVTADLT